MEKSVQNDALSTLSALVPLAPNKEAEQAKTSTPLTPTARDGIISSLDLLTAILDINPGIRPTFFNYIIFGWM